MALWRRSFRPRACEQSSMRNNSWGIEVPCRLNIDTLARRRFGECGDQLCRLVAVARVAERDLLASRSQDHLGEAISNRLRETFGVNVPVLTRTGAEMASIVAANPYQRDDPTKVVVTFLAANGVPPDLDLDAFAPEGLTLHGREMYLDLPFGQGRSPLAEALTKFDDGTQTARNWRTVLALKEMSSSPVD